MSNDQIRYDLLVQEAMRGVVRRVLAKAAREGLPGEHHFYITFRTGVSGVRVSSRMREKYPEEMTIILQHQFWDLAVTDHGFEVGLSFANIPERLVIPFDAVTGFYDPSVPFGLKIELQDAAAEIGANDATSTAPAAPARSTPRSITSEPDAAAAPKPAAQPRPRPSAVPSPAKATEDAPRDETPKAPEEKADNTTKVVSIDAFRKKT